MSSSDMDLQSASHEAVSRTLHRQGLRVTPQRRLVLHLLQEQGGHLSADELYHLARQRQPHISLSTVYRALDIFEGLGLVRALHVEGQQHRYEMVRDGKHHHMICIACGRVIEFECSHCAQVHQDLAECHGFQITTSNVQLLGYCAECRVRRDRRKV